MPDASRNWCGHSSPPTRSMLALRSTMRRVFPREPPYYSPDVHTPIPPIDSHASSGSTHATSAQRPCADTPFPAGCPRSEPSSFPECLTTAPPRHRAELEAYPPMHPGELLGLVEDTGLRSDRRPVRELTIVLRHRGNTSAILPHVTLLLPPSTLRQVLAYSESYQNRPEGREDVHPCAVRGARNP